MKLLAALAAGYVLGSRAGGEDLDDVVRSLRAIKDSDEFKDLLASLRSHAGHALRELASMVEGSAEPSDGVPELASTHDLVERVRQLAGLR
jgi:hypothetical protein